MVTIVILWCNKFSQGRECVKDSVSSGTACVAGSDENARQLEPVSGTNRSIKVRECSQMMSISPETVYFVVHSLGYLKVAVRWNLRLLTFSNLLN